MVKHSHKMKKCKFCNGFFKPNHNSQTICSDKCNKENKKAREKAYRESPKNKTKAKAYRDKPEAKAKVKLYRDKLENKLKRKAYDKIYWEDSRNKVRRKVYRESPENKVKAKAYREDPKNKEITNKKARQRRKIDSNYNTQCLIHSSFSNAMKYYSKTGKIKSMKKYGIDIKFIIKHLGEKPKGKYEIDHIIPKSWFNHNNPLEVKWCWAPENLQWLRADINRWKNDRFILKLSLEEQKKWEKK